jgi:predicted xylose isomerase-like sugar epimerase
MSAPVELVPKDKRERDQTQQSVVATAEELLADAKNGKVKAIVLATKDDEGGWHHRLTHNLEMREELGAVLLLMLQRGLQVLGEFENE